MPVVKEDIQSPCVRRCTLDPETDICVGCGRSVGEITHWTRMSKERRQRVLARIANHPRLPPRTRTGSEP